MLTKINIFLDYQCYPVWLYDENDDIIDTLLPEELRPDFELDSLFDSIQSKYDSLFIDDGTEFKYLGFENENDRLAFLNECDNAIKKLTERCKGRYQIINRIKI